MAAPLARDVMSRNLLVVHDDDPVAECARALRDRGVTGAPVLDRKERLVGVVSASDIVANELNVGRTVVSEHDEWLRPELGAPEELRHLGMHVEEYAQTRVRDIMTPVVLSAPPDATLGELAEIMGVNRVHRVLVVEDDRLVGVVSALDLLGYVPARAAPGPDGSRSVLWATDLGPDAERVGLRALRLARRLRARLLVLHVTPDLASLWPGHGERPEVVELQQKLQERALERLRALAGRLQPEHPAIEVEERVGAPAEVILAAARERRPEVLVVGAQRPASERLPGLGSVAERVLASSAVPVLTVPPP